MKKDPQIFLRHILDSIEAIEAYTQDLSKEEFIDSQEKQDSIIRRIEIIGEAVRNLDENFRQEYPEVVWRKIVGMRDKLIHEYFGVDLDLIWEVVKRYLPDLKEQIKGILK
jgi:uncharacterized protein with HEPN domain